MTGTADSDEKPGATKTPKQIYPAYRDKEAVEKGLRDKTLIRGTLRIGISKPSTAYVTPDGCKARENDLVVIGRIARNRAVNGDVVIVELMNEGEAVLRANEPLDPEENEQEEEMVFRKPPGLGDDTDSDDEDITFAGGLLEEDAPEPSQSTADGSSRKGKGKGKGKRKGGDDRQHACVVAIADPLGSKRVMVCTLHPNKRNRQEGETEDVPDDMVLEGDAVLRAVPTDSRMPWILIQVNEASKNILKIPGRLDKYKLWPVQMLKWNETSHLPLGRLKGECLGTAGDLEAEERHALIEHELDSHHVDFEDAELDEVDSVVKLATASFEEECRKRHDLRRKRIFTIDPATARDLDDAIHVDRVPGKDQVEVGVHIADVAHFLKLGSIADKEAQRRTTSIYLINRVLPMLPHALCNHLCSLNPNEPKVSFSVFFRLDIATGELVRDPMPWFQKTVMSSVCRLNYDEVQEMLDGHEIEHPPVYGGWNWSQIQDDIWLLYDVCGKVRRGRMSGGALSITKAKMIFHTRESEDGIPTGYHLEEHAASHWIIEELMLLANRCVAEHLANSELSSSSVLRNHKAPDPKKAESLQTLMRANLGLEWDGSNAGTIYKCCQEIHKKYGETMALAVEMMVMRCGMMQAEYFTYGTPGESPHHFALNFDYYTHFTSPIRRYPDVMVHRVLASLLGLEDEYQEGDQALEQCTICNGKRGNARKCQEQMDRAVFCIYLRARKEWFYTVGTVLGMKEDQKSGKDMITIYSSQLGKEKKVLLCSEHEASKLELYKDLSEDDELLLPKTWRFEGKGACDLLWEDPENKDKDPQAQKSAR
jgi:VacB/RNase II family 3'-5' exoribonuclease